MENASKRANRIRQLQKRVRTSDKEILALKRETVKEEKARSMVDAKLFIQNASNAKRLVFKRPNETIGWSSNKRQAVKAFGGEEEDTTCYLGILFEIVDMRITVLADLGPMELVVMTRVSKQMKEQLHYSLPQLFDLFEQRLSLSLTELIKEKFAISASLVSSIRKKFASYPSLALEAVYRLFRCYRQYGALEVLPIGRNYGFDYKGLNANQDYVIAFDKETLCYRRASDYSYFVPINYAEVSKKRAAHFERKNGFAIDCSSVVPKYLRYQDYNKIEFTPVAYTSDSVLSMVATEDKFVDKNDRFDYFTITLHIVLANNARYFLSHVPPFLDLYECRLAISRHMCPFYMALGDNIRITNNQALYHYVSVLDKALKAM